MLGFLNRFIDSNEREVKRLQPLVDQTNALEAEFKALSDIEIRERIADIRVEIQGTNMRCYLNDQLIHDATYPSPEQR